MTKPAQAGAGELQAIVLAAGIGRRMLPLSAGCHKALLPVAGTTILARIVDSLLAVGVADITVVTGYRAAEVRSYLERNYPAARVRFLDNARYETTNNIVSLALALESIELDADVLLLECDLLFDPSVLARVAQRRGNVALVDRYRTGMDGTVVAVAGGLVTQVFPTHLQGPQFDYGDKFKTLNIYRFDHEFCRRTLRPLLSVYAEQIDATCYYEIVLGMLANVPAHRIAAEVVEGDLWAEVDDPNDLAAARFRFEPGRRAELLDSSHGGQWNLGVEDFAFMRNAHFPPPAMLAALRHALPELLGSYGSSQRLLDEKLALFLGCHPARVRALNGASQAFPILRELFAGRRVALPEPTFGEFGRMFPASRRYQDEPGVDLEALDTLAGEVDLLVVVSPNNPTGTTLPTRSVHDLARRHPATTVLVDESFVAFSGEEPLRDLVEADPLENVVVLSSLSKLLGVPGLRLGYLYSTTASFLADLDERLPIWNLNAIAEHFLELAVKFRPELAAALEATAADRDALRDMLEALPGVAQVHPSGGDFLLVRLEGPAERAGRVRAALLEGHAVSVKDVSSRFPGGLGHLRVAVRRDEENRRLAELMGEALRGDG